MKDSRLIHNNFFLKVFKDIRNSADLLKGIFLPDIVRLLDFDSIQTEDGGYVDESLRNHLSDLVIKLNTKTGEKADVYVLFEHKSYSDENILWQLLKYQYLMLEEDFRAKRKFRIIVPVVFYHGKSKWKVEKSLFRSMKVPESLKKYALNFEYMLFDTKDFDMSQNEKFGRNAYLMSAMSLMKEMKEMDPEKTVIFFQYLAKSGLVKDRDFVLILIEYLARTNDIEENKIMDIINSELGSETEEIMPTLAQKWLDQGKAEGREEGREKGREEGREETCRNALRSKISPETVAIITGLPLEKVLEIQKELK